MANEQTSARVAGLATQANAVRRSNLSLLGVFGPEDSMRALIRLPSGRTRTVKRGSRLSQGQIIAIDAHGLVLNQRGETRRLEMPGG
ncbi:hypothetical protein AB838_09215 [Rhodobacteraceae bacterium (ex Bugula neritina AB1)]|nr:hypothetical protein AB838_09215 [Rhodobacteraceae bacterium (ex Bugula neritina AB1)]